MIKFSIIDAADQQFGTIINGQRVTFRIRWNLTSGFWSLDLAIDDVPVLTGIRVVLGSDLLAPYEFDIGRIFALDFKPGSRPGRAELPSGDVRLYHVMEEEIEAEKARIAEALPDLPILPEIAGAAEFTAAVGAAY